MARDARRALIDEMRLTYRRADRLGKRRLLDEICARTGYHRKYAIQLLNQFGTRRPPRRRGRPPVSQPLTDKVLGAMWYALGCPGARRFRARLPEGLAWARQQFRLARRIEDQITGMSLRTLDRRLTFLRAQIDSRCTKMPPRKSPSRSGGLVQGAPGDFGKGLSGMEWPAAPTPARSSSDTARRIAASRPQSGGDEGSQGEGIMSAEFTTRKQKDVLIVSAEGKMVAGDQAFRLMKLAIRTMNETDIRKFVIDLGKVSLIDSAGVGELVAVNSAVREKGGQLRLANLEDKVGKVLQMALINKIIPSFDTQKEALASLTED